jgi:hypothetical protein
MQTPRIATTYLIYMNLLSHQEIIRKQKDNVVVVRGSLKAHETYLSQMSNHKETQKEELILLQGILANTICIM